MYSLKVEKIEGTNVKIHKWQLNNLFYDWRSLPTVILVKSRSPYLPYIFYPFFFLNEPILPWISNISIPWQTWIGLFVMSISYIIFLYVENFWRCVKLCPLNFWNSLFESWNPKFSHPKWLLHSKFYKFNIQKVALHKSIWIIPNSHKHAFSKFF